MTYASMYIFFRRQQQLQKSKPNSHGTGQKRGVDKISKNIKSQMKAKESVVRLGIGWKFDYQVLKNQSKSYFWNLKVFKTHKEIWWIGHPNLRNECFHLVSFNFFVFLSGFPDYGCPLIYGTEWKTISEMRFEESFEILLHHQECHYFALPLKTLYHMKIENAIPFSTKL